MPDVLSQAALRTAVLARQRLLSPVDASVPEALRLVGGLQAQYAPSIYVGLWSRLTSFSRSDLTAALENRTAVQGTLQRITIHLVDRSDYWPFALAVRDARRRTWLRAYRHIPESALLTAAERLDAALAEGPLSRKQVEGLVGKELVNGVGLWLDLLRVPPSGTWERRRADLFASAARELGPMQDLDVRTARLHLIRRYLHGFGPASAADIASYTGLLPGEVKPLLADLELRQFVAEDGTMLVDVPEGLLPDADTPVPVRFLPTWDATLLVHCRRTGILPEQYRPADLRDQDAAIVSHVSGRRTSRRDLAARGRCGDAGTVRTIVGVNSSGIGVRIPAVGGAAPLKLRC